MSAANCQDLPPKLLPTRSFGGQAAGTSFAKLNS